MSINISAVEFKAASKRLTAILREEKNTSPGYAKSLQIMSRALFGKPYEEVLATLLKDHPEDSWKGCIAVLQFGQDKLIVQNGEYVSGSFPGTDLEMSGQNFDAIVEGLHKKTGLPVIQECIAFSEAESTEVDDIIKRAAQMGLFEYRTTIFDLLQDGSFVILIDEKVSRYGLSDDWREKIEEEGIEAICWMPEASSELDLYEWFVSFRQLCEAVPLNSEGTIWKIPYEDGYDMRVVFR